MITLYHDPISTTSRAVLLFLAEHDLEVELVKVSLSSGEHRSREYATLNPNQAVPTLVDGDLVIGECSAILKYLADVAQSPAYPLDLKARARINAMMDWFNTGFSKDFNYNYVYPQIFPHHRIENPGAQAAVQRRGLENGRCWLSILEDCTLDDGRDYLLGDAITIADYLGAACLSASEAIDFNLSPWPRVAAWLERMRSRPSWDEVFADFHGLVASVRHMRSNAVWTPVGRLAFAMAS